MAKEKFMARHGDILVEAIERLPLKAKVKKGNVIISSSNDHILEGQGKIYELGEDLYLKITGKANLNHTEHKEIDLPKGVYKVVRQIEFNGYDNVIVED